MMLKAAVLLSVAGVSLADDCYGPLVYSAKLPSVPGFEPFSYVLDDDDCDNSQQAYLQYTAESNPDAVCLDGTSGSYYLVEVEDAVGTLVFFDNQGLCVTEEECLARATPGAGLCGDYGTGTGFDVFTPAAPDDGYVVFSADSETNPIYFNYNKVFVHDCDGGSFSSTRGAVSVGDETIYMNGATIVQTMFAQLEEGGLMDDKIVLASTNYASVGLMYWIQDWVAERYTTSVDTLIYSGFFFEHSGHYSSLMNPYDHAVFEGTYEEFWTSAIATHGIMASSWSDVLTANSLAGATERTLLMGSRFDPWQLTSAFGEEYSSKAVQTSDWGNGFNTALASAVNSNALVFSITSYCQFTGDVYVTKDPQLSDDVCEAYDAPWENTEYQASSFRVEESISTDTGVSLSEAMSLFNYGIWPPNVMFGDTSAGFSRSESCFSGN